MNFLRSLTITVVMGLSLPLLCQESLPRVSAEGIEQAQISYALEVERAPYVRAGLVTGVAAIGGFFAYKYLYAASTPELAKIEKCIEQLKYDQLKLVQKIEYIKQEKNIEWSEVIQPPQKPWLERRKGDVYSLASWILSSGAFGLASSLVVAPALEGIVSAKNMLPSSGDLLWYLKHRTSYSQDLADMKRYVMHQVRRATFCSIIPLFVSDIEKIIGYIQCTSAQLNYEPVVARFNTICENLKAWTNELVEVTEQELDLALIQQQLFKIEAEVHSAVRLVKTYT